MKNERKSESTAKGSREEEVKESKVCVLLSNGRAGKRNQTGDEEGKGRKGSPTKTTFPAGRSWPVWGLWR